MKDKFSFIHKWSNLDDNGNCKNNNTNNDNNIFLGRKIRRMIVIKNKNDDYNDNDKKIMIELC